MASGTLYRAAALAALILSGVTPATAGPTHCPDYRAGKKNLYWGDLHVHTAYSLDAYGYGTVKTPADAYRFARGHEIELPDGSTVRLARPLDFAAVTDHAEWFDLMYVCTHPLFLDDPYCRTITTKNSPESGAKVFSEYVRPTITLEEPTIPPLCKTNAELCAETSLNQWQRIQAQAHAAYDACRFTAFVGFEWSATPAGRHMHRNVIFAGEHVTERAIDYIHYPTLDAFWEQLDRQCRPEDGCDAITIPHNNNLSGGLGFDVETESERTLERRARFERLVEIHQEKGNSECLSPFGMQDEDDCGFEIYLTHRSKPEKRREFTAQEWEQMRRSYVRSLLLRGLAAYDSSTGHQHNPLQLGIVGSTDNHTASPGHVEEDQWHGSAFGAGDFARAMTRVDWNPGGLVAVWAEENTRQSLFAAMKRREVYATSGPRIRLQFSASTGHTGLSCPPDDGETGSIVAMGGDFTDGLQPPLFRIIAKYDLVPLQKIEIIKGEWRNGEARETRHTIWSTTKGGKDICRTWADPDFDPSAPAFWYARVSQRPTPRWSATLCRQQGQCDDYPRADRRIRERAWSSPIWFYPSRSVGTEPPAGRDTRP